MHSLIASSSSHPSSPLTAHTSFSQKHLASSFLLGSSGPYQKRRKTSKNKTLGLFLYQ
jgi:hypothetical protein